ncbi:MAG: two-component system sensor histidine kinase NtrB [Nitrospirota bacterium]
MADIELLNKAIESFNSASATLTQYYRTLEDRVKLLTEEVDHKKQLLNSILDSIDVGVVFFDKDGVIRLVNSTVEQLLQVKAEEMVGGRSLHATISDEIIVPERAKPFYALLSRSEVRDRTGGSTGHVLIFKDITRLKQLESENARNARLSAMGELVLKIAHEIRNPLGSIELFASLLANDLGGTAHGDYANRISNSVRSLVNTLDNMLKFSRGITPKTEPCVINEVIEEIIGEFKELFSAGKITVAVTAADRYRLCIDKGLVRQAMINIFLNAVQAMPDGGRIAVTIDSVDAPFAGIEIVIADSGTGMEEATKSRIFEPFFSTKDRGTGLGLSITAGIIAAHKGTIDVASEAGKGTEFRIKLPKEE